VNRFSGCDSDGRVNMPGDGGEELKKSAAVTVKCLSRTTGSVLLVSSKDSNRKPSKEEVKRVTAGFEW
jgi:hypothetical protein